MDDSEKGMDFRMGSRFLLCIIMAVSLAACASQDSFQESLLRQIGVERRVIQEITVSESEITISGNGNRPFGYLISRSYQDFSPPGLVVLLKELELGKYRQPIVVNKGPVIGIIPRRVEGRSGWRTELHIGLNRTMDYQVKEQGNKLIIALKDEGSKPSNEVLSEQIGIERRVIQEITVSESEITISGNGNRPFGYLISRSYQDFSPPGLVVLLKELELGKYRQPMVVNKGPVIGIVPHQVKGRSEWGTKLHIGLNRTMDYQVKEQGSKLIIALRDANSKPSSKVALKTDAREPEPPKNDTPYDSQPLEGQASSYMIGPEDVLDIIVWKNAELSKVVTVRPDGKISLPLIGDIQAAGLTADILREAIKNRLKEFQKVPEVSVIVQEVNSNSIYILGEVARPGKYQLKSYVTLLQAISLAGGFTPFASRNDIKVLRKGAGKAREETLKIRYKDIVSKGDTGKNILLRPGDTIIVP